MKSVFFTTILSVALAGAAFAAGEHAGGHGHAMMAIGKPGDRHFDRTVEITMRETEDGMVYEPAELNFNAGETIKFVITNAGEFEHEFVMDTSEKNQEHKALMAKMDMEHDDPNSVRLDPGMKGEILWTFSNAGTFEFACLIPGHYESGMHGPITVN
ncbi:cupredoxin family protein [Antarcticimicrobium luteum]|uniref:cupredoxin domain-containing protein n=1 Tax=Antarcticimicrobium luteum TaxID=2547397 RepID=UPI0026859847